MEGMSDNNTANNATDNATGYNANEVYGRIVVIKRTGQDSASFELMDDSYTFGRATECDIRIQLASIAEQHCKIIRNEHGQAVLVKLNEENLCVNNSILKEESRLLEHNDIFTLVERSFRYEYTPEMLAKAQLASAHETECVAGTIPLSMETPKKPSSLSASVFSISEVPSSPATPKTPVPAIRVNSNNGSNGQSPRVAASPMTSNVVDSEITTSPKLSPKVFKMDGEMLGSVSPFNIVGASSLGTSVVSSTDGHVEFDKENAAPLVENENVVVEKPVDEPVTVDNVAEAVENAENVKSVETVENAEEVKLEATSETVEAPVESEPVVDSVTETFESPIESAAEVQTESVTEIPVEEQAVTETEVVNESSMQVENVCEPAGEIIFENPVETISETIEAVVETVERVAEVCDDAVMESTETVETAEATETVESVEDVVMSETVEAVSEFANQVCGDVEMTESTSVDSVAETPIETEAATECADIAMEVVEAAEVCDSVMENTDAVECESVMETTGTAEANESVDSVMDTVAEIANVESATETTEAEHSESAVEVSDSVLEASKTVETSEPVMTAEAVESVECVTEVVDAVIETCQEFIEGSEVTVEELGSVIAAFEAAESVSVETVETAAAVEVATEEIECESISVVEESVVVEAVESNIDHTEAIRIEDIACESAIAVETSFAEEANESVAIGANPVTAEACEEAVREENIMAAECPAVVSESESAAPAEVEMSTSEPQEVTESKSTEVFVNAYESASENSSPMEGIEVTGEEIEEKNEEIEAPAVAETPVEGVVVEAEPVSEVTDYIQPDIVESAAEPTVEPATTETLETAPETPEVSAEPSTSAECDVDTAAPAEVIATPVKKDEVEASEELEVSVEPTAADSHVEDNLEVSIDPDEEVTVDIRVGNEEIASIEISAVEIAVPASPARKESDELSTSTPGPQRKSTRVHVTPKALESVKKQEHAGESVGKRVLRSTGGRQLRSRVNAEPASPKGRNQKRSADEDENVDPSALSLSADSNKKTKTKGEDSENTPLRRSTRSRVQK